MIDSIYEAIKDNKKLIITYDCNPENPRDNNDGLISSIVSWTRSYNIGDSDLLSEYPTLEDFQESGPRKKDCLFFSPLYMYEHSNISISLGSFGDPWDSGQIGYVYVTKERANELYPKLEYMSELEYKEEIAKRVKNEIDIYNDYIEGNVYAYRILEDRCEPWVDPECVESCSGFYQDNTIPMNDRWKTMIDYMSDMAGNEYSELFEKIKEQVNK